MKLNRGVFFRRYGELVYLRHTVQRKDYLFNETAGDFLDWVRSHPGGTPEELCEALSQEYELEDRADFDRQMEAFGAHLLELEILEPEQTEVRIPDLRDRVRAEVRNSGQLFSATLELTYRCNEHCIHCYVDDTPDCSRELTPAEYSVLLDQLWDMGCMNLLLTGGEVTMRRDFMEIAECAVNKGFCVDVYTNGLTLTGGQIETLARLGVNSVSFSLYGPDAQSHDAITQVPGSFDRTFRNMLLCKCAGLDTYAKTVVMKQNYDRLEELLALGRLAGISINTSTAVTASHGGKPAELFRLMDTEKYRHVTELALCWQAVEDWDAGLEGHVPALCQAGVDSLCIDPYGNVLPCNAIYEPLGNIREAPLDEIWRNAPFLKRLKNLRFEAVCPKGGRCEDAPWCNMCLGSAYSESRTWVPTADACMMAQGTHRACQDRLNRKKEDEHEDKTQREEIHPA